MKPAPIRLDTDTWAVMRDTPDHPKAIIHRVTDTAGESRYLVMVWHPEPSKRRMAGIFDTIQAADRSVLYDRARVTEALSKTNGPPNGGGTTNHAG